jgi:hypothetical protein
MIEVRRDRDIHLERGNWFDARWHFSFDQYRDPDQMGIGPLRVFNDDRLIADAAWPMHPHRDVEGCTYVVEGTFEHADSLGNGGTLLPGAVQRMTLGSGAQHSERNGSKTEPMRFLQFWILPDTAGLPPETVQRQFTKQDRTNQLLEVIGGERSGRGEDFLPVHQDSSVYVASLDEGTVVKHELSVGRAGYLYLIDGAVHLAGVDAVEALNTGDAAKLFGPEDLAVTATAPSELILIEVASVYVPIGVWARSG